MLPTEVIDVSSGSSDDDVVVVPRPSRMVSLARSSDAAPRAALQPLKANRARTERASASPPPAKRLQHEHEHESSLRLPPPPDYCGVLGRGLDATSFGIDAPNDDAAAAHPPRWRALGGVEPGPEETPAVAHARLRESRRLVETLGPLSGGRVTSARFAAALFTSWQLHAKFMHSCARIDEAAADPFLSGLVGDFVSERLLRERALSESEARSVAAAWARAAEEAAARVRAARPRATDPGSDWSDGSMRVSLHEVADRPRAAVVVRWAPPEGQRHVSRVLRRDRFDLLRAAYASRGHDPRKLATRLFVALLRVECMSLHSAVEGEQGALLPEVFAVLGARFGVRFECFASPFNASAAALARGGGFASAHPDADRFFGGVGRWWEIEPLEGSFELNPPFALRAELVIDHVVRALQQSLEAGSSAPRPLSFLVTLPRDAFDARAADETVKPWITRRLVLAKGDHMYLRGMRHRLGDEQEARWRASKDTVLLFLQNPAGARLWPTTGSAGDAAIAELVDAFRARGRERAPLPPPAAAPPPCPPLPPPAAAPPPCPPLPPDMHNGPAAPSLGRGRGATIPAWMNAKHEA